MAVFGKNRIAEMLKGSDAEAFQRSGLQSQSTYGLLKGWRLESIRELIDQLMEAGYLRISGLEYPVLSLSPEGLKAMKGEIAVELPIAETVPVEETRSRTRASRSRRSRTKTSAPRDPLPEEPAHSELLESLRLFRREEARKQNVPAYVIFHDSTLQEIAARKPLRLDALSTISGLGTKRLELYGEKGALDRPRRANLAGNRSKFSQCLADLSFGKLMGFLGLDPGTVMCEMLRHRFHHLQSCPRLVIRRHHVPGRALAMRLPKQIIGCIDVLIPLCPAFRIGHRKLPLLVRVFQPLPNFLSCSSGEIARQT